jgi:penicillin-insensitive murein endopeptidase
MKFRQFGRAALAVLALAASPATAEPPAKELFGAQKLPSQAAPQSLGFYSKGCLDGAVAIPIDGPHWQVMRLSRNRNWGHPHLIALLEKLAADGAKVGWPGLMIGDISQPRGGPMLTGHASHQIGLDADVWLNPMPNRRLTAKEREDISAVSMIKGDTLYVDPDVWTSGQVAILKTAASYPEVERILVHPGIKKKLCDTVKGDRAWLSKIRPNWGHNYHFHMRIKCQAGSPGCKGQEKVAAGEGCDSSLAWWFTDEPWKKSPVPVKKKPPLKLSDLPAACANVLQEPAAVQN